MHTLLLGETNSGKTTRCEKIIADAKARGLKVGGVLSKSVFKNNKKIGNDIINLLTNQSLPLCRQKSIANSPGIETDNYIINESAIPFGKKAIRNALDCGLIVIDEVGTLELNGGGFFDELKLVLDSGRDAFITLKKKHKEKFLRTFPHVKFRILEL